MRIMALPVDNGGCGWYRVRQPLAMLKENTKHDAYVVDPKDNMEEIIQVMHLVDVFVCRQGVKIAETKKQFNEVLGSIGKKLKAKWVMDIDDNMELISPYSEHYMDSGIEEYYDHNLKKWLWKDGVAGFDLKHNREKWANAIQSLKDADMVTVTTDKLAEYASRYNNNVWVLPNSIDFSKWWKLPFKKNKQLRVGWSGGVSHYEDWYAIKKPLNEMLRKYRFKLVMVGTPFTGIIDDDLKDLVEAYAWASFDAHSYRMMCMNLDLAIIPLADLPFNHYKSSIKWYEMSALQIPSIVSNVEPYAEVIRNEETALGYVDATSFKKSLSKALDDVVLRKKIGKNAYNWVYKHRNAKLNTKYWAEAYESLL